jgi:hypothetical protein
MLLFLHPAFHVSLHLPSLVSSSLSIYHQLSLTHHFPIQPYLHVAMS